MRETKFRGKSVETGEWVYGSLVQEDEKAWIVGGISIEDAGGVFDFYATEWYEVIPETVGQYTELKDKKGVEIYEGDIFRGKSGFMIVKFENGAFITEYKFNIRGYEEVNIMHLSVTSRGAKVIGNIHDNPELLEETK